MTTALGGRTKVQPARRSLCLTVLAALLGIASPAAAQGVTADAAFGQLEVLLQTIRQTPPSQRSGLLDRLYAECGSFLDVHLADASPEQLSMAGTTWLQLASRNGDEEAIRLRLQALRTLKEIPPDLERLVRLHDAQLSVKVGAAAPAWSAADIRSGEEATLAGLRGKLVLVLFWSSRNPSCQAFMQRKLTPLHARHREDGRLCVVGIGSGAAGETPEQQAAFCKEHGFEWTMVHDASGSIALAHGAAGEPFLCLVDEQGKILAIGRGWRIIRDVARLLEERLGAGAEDEEPPPGEQGTGENEPG